MAATICPPLDSLMGTEMLSIFVSKKRKEFNVHKGLICSSSKFFRDAFEGGFKETKNNTMYMPEDDADAFSSFTNWLYRNPIPSILDRPVEAEEIVDGGDRAGADEFKEHRPITKEEHQLRVKEKQNGKIQSQEDFLRPQVNTLLQLYFLAEKRFINDLMNRIMDQLRSSLRDFEMVFTHPNIKLIYTNTRPGSRLRDFCSELVVFSMENEDVSKLLDLQMGIPELAVAILRHCKELINFKAEVCIDIGSADPHEWLKEDLCCMFYNHSPCSFSNC